MGSILIGACLSLFPWQSLPGAEIARVAVERNDLGVSFVEIESRLQNGDRLLVVRGLDKSGKEIAVVSLRTAWTRPTGEPRSTPDNRPNPLAELRLTVGEERGYSLVPRGLGTREVLEPPEVSLAGFIRLPAVAAALERQAGIRFVQEKKVTGATPCSGSNFPTNLANPPECCQDGEFLWQVVGSGPDIGKVAKRKLGRPCTQADGVSVNCGIGASVPCTFGPCGTANVPEWPAGIIPSHVFVPASQPRVCGWDTNGDPVPAEGGATFFPEPYVGQTLYPEVPATCPYRDCLADGTPVVTGFALTVTAVTSGATGEVRSKFQGISIDGAGSDSWGYEGGAEVTLTAEAIGDNARAVFSGACSVSGPYGEKATCTLTMDATKAVTVTYQCEPGFTCQQ
jgi:hypothetical protein